MLSPDKKRLKLCSEIKPQSLSKKRESVDEVLGNKRPKLVSNEDEQIRTLKRRNFIKACEQVSNKAYFDLRQRIGLLSLPTCARPNPEHYHKTVSLCSTLNIEIE